MEDDREDKPRLELSAKQVIASALAATSASVAASTIGVAGTVIGAAVMSAISITASAVYNFSMERTAHHVRRTRIVSGRFVIPVHDAPSTAGTGEEERQTVVEEISGPEEDADTEDRRPLRMAGIFALAAAAIFLAVMGGITLIEFAVGKPIAAVFSGDDTGGTSVGRTVEGKLAPAGGGRDDERRNSPSPSASPTSTPSPTDTPSARSPGPTTSPTVAPTTASTSAAPTPTPSESESAPSPTEASPEGDVPGGPPPP